MVIFARFEHKKDPAKLLLQGQFYNLVCLLRYKAECLFTNVSSNQPFAIAACAAARRAIGTRNGEQDT